MKRNENELFLSCEWCTRVQFVKLRLFNKGYSQRFFALLLWIDHWIRSCFRTEQGRLYYSKCRLSIWKPDVVLIKCRGQFSNKVVWSSHYLSTYANILLCCWYICRLNILGRAFHIMTITDGYRWKSEKIGWS